MEVYGPKPKRFTKEWWENYWYHYKWLTLGVIFGVTMLCIGLYQVFTSTEYDLKVDYISKEAVFDDRTMLLALMAQEQVSDATENGKNEVYVLEVTLGKDMAQTSEAYQTLFAIEMSMSDSYVFLIEEDCLEQVLVHGILEPTTAWAGDKANDGFVIPIENNHKLVEIGMMKEDGVLYLGVLKMRPEQEEDELERKRHENGVKFANYLINQE